MDDRSSLFAMALGLNHPWFVSEIKLDTAKGRLDLDIDFEKGTKFPCPKCGKMCALHDTTF
ncbi:MAG: ISL3 family transposase, partial [Methanomassiliicoccales archaeon]